MLQASFSRVEGVVNYVEAGPVLVWVGEVAHGCRQQHVEKTGLRGLCWSMRRPASRVWPLRDRGESVAWVGGC